jgi:hypothetical protein
MSLYNELLLDEKNEEVSVVDSVLGLAVVGDDNGDSTVGSISESLDEHTEEMKAVVELGSDDDDDDEDDVSVAFACPKCGEETKICESESVGTCPCGFSFTQSKSGYIKDGFVVDTRDEDISEEDTEEDSEEEEESDYYTTDETSSTVSSESDGSDDSWVPKSKFAKISSDEDV